MFMGRFIRSTYRSAVLARATADAGSICAALPTVLGPGHHRFDVVVEWSDGTLERAEGAVGPETGGQDRRSRHPGVRLERAARLGGSPGPALTESGGTPCPGVPVVPSTVSRAPALVRDRRQRRRHVPSASSKAFSASRRAAREVIPSLGNTR